MYKLGTKYGLISGWFAKNAFGLCNQKLISLSSVIKDKEMSVRELVKADSIGNGQGYIKCGCRIGKCDKNCVCKKAGLVCNSRCHNKEANANCVNK